MPTEIKLKKIDGYTPAQLALVTRTVAKKATPDELAMFMHTAKKTGLDPFLKEIWFIKDSKDNVIMMTGRDGFLSIAQRSGEFAGLQSAAVYENDEFAIDYATSTIKHLAKAKERGLLIGAWAMSHRKGCAANITYVDFATYNRPNANQWSPWKNYPAAMIIKCAESIALKKQFGISGLVSTEEMGYEPQPEVEAPKLDTGKAFDDQLKKIEALESDKRKMAAIKMLETPPFELTPAQQGLLKALTQ